MTHQSRFFALRDDGLTAWAAAQQLYLTQREQHQFEREYRKREARKKVTANSLTIAAPSRFLSSDVYDEDEREARYVAACLARGGFPRASVFGGATVWVGWNGLVWKGGR